jgi:hypothetical protein
MAYVDEIYTLRGPLSGESVAKLKLKVESLGFYGIGLGGEFVRKYKDQPLALFTVLGTPTHIGNHIYVVGSPEGPVLMMQCVGDEWSISTAALNWKLAWRAGGQHRGYLWTYIKDCPGVKNTYVIPESKVFDFSTLLAPSMEDHPEEDEGSD